MSTLEKEKEKEKIKIKVQAVLREVFEKKDLEIHDELNAEDIEEWDSFAHLNLIMTLEQKFSVNFALGELQDMKNIGDLLCLLEDKLL